MTPEAKLDVLLRSATPPARDYAFEAEVARRLALRRAWLGAAALLPWAIVAAVLLWALSRTAAPHLAAAGEALEPAVTAAVMALAGAGLLLWAVRRLRFSAA